MWPFNLLSTSKTRDRGRLPIRPILEALEERWLLNGATIIVTTPFDDPTTPIAGQTTLRDAINQANATTGDVIEFAPSAANYVIEPTAALPAIAGAGTEIIGNEYGNTSTANTYLDGSKNTAAFSNGLDVEASNVTIQGMNILNFSGTGIHVYSGDSVKIADDNIGYVPLSTTRGADDGGIYVEPNATNAHIVGNVISDNQGQGVVVASANGTVIQSNTIEDNRGEGILVNMTNTNSTLIGGNSANLGNTISGNGTQPLNGGAFSGIDIYGTGSGLVAEGNTIDDNVGNGISVGYLDGETPSNFLGSGGTVIGSDPFQDGANSISGNGGNGIEINGNLNFVVGNTISSNGVNGVEVYAGYADSIELNSIANNDAQGIFLRGSANASAVPPALTSVQYAANSGSPTLTIQGNLPLPPDAADGPYYLEFFANTPTANPQGQTLLGSYEVTANGGANTPFTATLTLPTGVIVGPTDITATAEDPYGNSSEFSNALLVTPSSSAPTPTLSTPTATPSTVAAGGTLQVSTSVEYFNVIVTAVNEGTVTFSLVNATTGVTLASDTGVAVQNGTATDANFTVPTTAAAGSYNLVASYTDNGGSFGTTSVMASNAVNVKTASAITFSLSALPDGTLGTAYAQSILASGPHGTPTVSYQIISGALPTGMKIAASSGKVSISGTPKAVGSVTFAVTAKDKFGDTATQDYTLTIDSAASITLSPSGGSLATGAVGTAYSQIITASGGSGALTVSDQITSGALPKGMKIAASGGKVTISGTSKATGSVTFAVTAKDKFGDATTQNYTLTVSASGSTTMTDAAFMSPLGTNALGTTGFNVGSLEELSGEIAANNASNS